MSRSGVEDTVARFSRCVRMHYATVDLVVAGNAIVGPSASGDRLVEATRLAVVDAMDAHLAAGGTNAQLDAELARVNATLPDTGGR